MPLITLTFTNSINTSVQVGDIVYYISTLTAGTFNYRYLRDGMELGIITAVRNREGLLNQSTDPIEIDVNCIIGNCSVPVGAFIMFSKDKSVNNTSLLGYYAEVKFVNTSKEKIELFSISSEVSESSK